MRINNNIAAMNTHRQYTLNTNAVAKSTEKLSSGYRINRAGDDAAGLAISEKMRAQIRGLKMASKNSQDAISLVQTAEGALQETHNILQRMRELAVQSASDTNEESIDRAALNAEFQQLIAEIDDTASKTKFNDMGVIDGRFAETKFTASATGTGVTVTASGLTSSAALNGVAPTYSANPAVTAAAPTLSFATGTPYTDTGITAISLSVGGTFAEGTDFNGATVTNFAIDGTDHLSITFDTAGGPVTFTSTTALGSAGNYTLEDGDGNQLTLVTTGDYDSAKSTDLLAALNAETIAFNNDGAEGTPASVTATLSVDGATLTGTVAVGATSLTLTDGAGKSVTISGFAALTDVSTTTEITGKVGDITISSEPGTPFVVQTGANMGDVLSINIENMNATSLKVNTSSIATREDASSAIQEVNDAINAVSTQRAKLGALQNRLNHKINNLDTSAENLSAAESRIRDLDMAQEMTTFTRNNIITQASTAMLAQANAAPQGVLSLLQ